jgi:hypothetical protein
MKKNGPLWPVFHLWHGMDKYVPYLVACADRFLSSLGRP